MCMCVCVCMCMYVCIFRIFFPSEWYHCRHNTSLSLSLCLFVSLFVSLFFSLSLFLSLSPPTRNPSPESRVWFAFCNNIASFLSPKKLLTRSLAGVSLSYWFPFLSQLEGISSCFLRLSFAFSSCNRNRMCMGVGMCIVYCVCVCVCVYVYVYI